MKFSSFAVFGIQRLIVVLEGFGEGVATPREGSYTGALMSDMIFYSNQDKVGKAGRNRSYPDIAGAHSSYAKHIHCARALIAAWRASDVEEGGMMGKR